MKSFRFLTILVMVAVLSGCQSKPSAESIVNDIQRAVINQKTAPEKINSAHMVLSDTDDNSTITLRYLAPDKFRLESIGDHSAELFIIDGSKGYAYSSGEGLVELTPQKTAELTKMIKAQPFNTRLTDVMTDIRVEGSARIGGEDCWILTGKDKSSAEGKKITVYVSKKNKLIRKIINAACTPESEVMFFDYTDFGGIKLPETAIETVDGKVSKRKILDAKWNVPIPASCFSAPTRLKQ